MKFFLKCRENSVYFGKENPFCKRKSFDNFENILNLLRIVKKLTNVIFICHTHYYSLNGKFNEKMIFSYEGEQQSNDDFIFFIKPLIANNTENYFPDDILALGCLSRNFLQKIKKIKP